MAIEEIGVIASLVGAAYAVLHGRRTRGIAKEALAIQQEAEERAQRRERERREAQKRATLRPRIQEATPGGWTGTVLLVDNVGQAVAREIRVELEGRDAKDSRFVEEPPGDYSRLAPDDPPLVFKLGRIMGDPERLSVRLAWDDDSGPGRQWEGEVDW